MVLGSGWDSWAHSLRKYCSFRELWGLFLQLLFGHGTSSEGPVLSFPFLPLGFSAKASTQVFLSSSSISFQFLLWHFFPSPLGH